MVTDKTRRECIHRHRIWGWCTPAPGGSAGRGIEYDDLYGAGCMGLVKA